VAHAMDFGAGFFAGDPFALFGVARFWKGELAVEREG